MITNSLGSRHGRRKLTSIDDGSTTLLYGLIEKNNQMKIISTNKNTDYSLIVLIYCTYSNEFSIEPSIVIDSLKDCLPTSGNVDVSMGSIRILGRGVVTPDNDIGHCVSCHTHTSSNLNKCTWNNNYSHITWPYLKLHTLRAKLSRSQ